VVQLDNLEAAAADFFTNADLDFVDADRLSRVIHGLEGALSKVVGRATSRGEHLLAGQSACTWVAQRCQMSKSSAADRLCIGAQLEKMPRVDAALSSGEIGLQAASVICHLQERVEQAGGSIDEEEWVKIAKDLSIKNLSAEAASTWHGIDPSGFNAKVEEAHERRQLFISECGDMYRIDGWLELEAGAAVKAAIDSLARPLGAIDDRSPKQRRADAVYEMAMGNRVASQISVHTTIEGLKGEVGAPASQLGDGTPISSKTVQRLACDGALHRVLKADSMVIDVGRAKRVAQPAQWRALKARHRTCGAPGCDRPIGMTQAHHVDFWEDGGHTNHRRMVPLCHHHHRLVHEGGWQVVLAGNRVDFIPPERPVMIRRRWGERRWAA
jgi:hypothetical protein